MRTFLSNLKFLSSRLIWHLLPSSSSNNYLWLDLRWLAGRTKIVHFANAQKNFAKNIYFPKRNKALISML